MTRRNSVARVSSFVNFRELRIESLEDRRLLVLTPELVADLDLLPKGIGLAAEGLVANDQYVFFSGEDEVAGRELWRSDGTAEGTLRLTDIRSGTADSNPRYLTVSGGRLFFVESGTENLELWSTDGTATGTRRVKDIRQGAAGSFPQVLTDVNGTLFFAADNGTNGKELWKSDGTAAGTVMVKDILPGSGSSIQFGFVAVGNRLFFTANDGIHGSELWVSDGTEEGTQLVADIIPGLSGSYPQTMAVHEGRVSINADDGIHGRELWSSDGTLDGTFLVKDITPGAPSSMATGGQGYVAGGRLFFAANDGTHGSEVWVSDGSNEGTQRLVDSIGGVAIGRYPVDWVAMDDTMLFVVTYGSSNALWASDGTAIGTKLLTRDVEYGLRRVGDLAYFSASDDATGWELWRTDATEAGTYRVKDLFPGTASSYSHSFVKLQDRVLFLASGELWISDGAESGTTMVTPAGTADFSPMNLFESGGAIYFHRATGLNDLWKSDGTESGTVHVADLRPESEFDYEDEFRVHGLTSVGSALYYWVFENPKGPYWGPYAEHLYGVDLNTGNVGYVKGFSAACEGPCYISTGPVVSANEVIYFAVFRDDDECAGNEVVIYRSNGTLAGTQVLPQLTGDGYCDSTGGLFSVGNAVYALADASDSTSIALWRIDTNPPIELMLLPSTTDFSGPVVEFNQELYFFPYGEAGLFKSDGTVAGTGAVREDFYATSVMVAGNLMYLSAFERGTGDYELWASDGTNAGTRLVKEIRPGSEGSTIAHMTAVDDMVYFTADDGVHGRALWKSDGTAEGTVMVQDIRPDSEGLDVRDTLAANGRLFFVADDGLHGSELWLSDGTEGGTHLFADIRVGIEGSAPTELTAAGNTLFFSADDGIHGRELWKVDVEDEVPAPPPAGPEFRVNTFTAGDQRGFPTSPGQIAMAGDGSFVVTWTSVGLEGTGDEIYFQRYSARGTPVGGEVRANAIAAGNQRNSTIAAAADGSFVIAWNSDHNATNNFDIYARRFDAQGVPLGEEFLVNALNVAGAQRSPVVTASPDGRFAVVWHGPDASSNGIFARLYASDGTPLSDEFPVNSHATGQQQIKSAAMAADGALIVVWQSDGQDGDTGGIYARIFEDDGTPRTNEFLAPQTSAGSQQNPSVAVDQAGNFLVTWTSDGQDGDAGGIYARRFNPDGEPQGDEFRVNETTASAQRYSTVAMDAEGDALITWSSLAQDGDGYGIYARRYSSAGQAEGHEFRVNTFTAGNQIYSSPALDADGDFVVVWSSQGQDGDGYGVYGQRYAFPQSAQPGDTDADGDVDLEDLNAVRNHFGEIGVGVLGDTLPFDGDVDLDDLNAVRNNFGATSSLSSELLARRNAPTRALMSDDSALASLAGATRRAEAFRVDHVQAAFDHVHAYAAGVWQRCNEALADPEVEATWHLAITPHGRRNLRR